MQLNIRFMKEFKKSVFLFCFQLRNEEEEEEKERN